MSQIVLAKYDAFVTKVTQQLQTKVAAFLTCKVRLAPARLHLLLSCVRVCVCACVHVHACVCACAHLC